MSHTTGYACPLFCHHPKGKVLGDARMRVTLEVRKLDKPKETQTNAIQFARKNKKLIAKRLVSLGTYKPDASPVSVFMAGSPGAGKTEASKALIEQFDGKILRIDPDELRSEFDAYDGSNSWLFQGAVSILVDCIHDLALKNRQTFLLDGTLSRFKKADENITRSLQKGRYVQILYVYQDPILAWKFVLAREIVEGRHIRKADFIAQYFDARDAVNALKEKFGREVKIDLLVKNIDASNKVYKANIDRVDHHIPEKYSRSQLEEMLDEG